MLQLGSLYKASPPSPPTQLEQLCSALPSPSLHPPAQTSWERGSSAGFLAQLSRPCLIDSRGAHNTVCCRAVTFVNLEGFVQAQRSMVLRAAQWCRLHLDTSGTSYCCWGWDKKYFVSWLHFWKLRRLLRDFWSLSWLAVNDVCPEEKVRLNIVFVLSRAF